MLKERGRMYMYSQNAKDNVEHSQQGFQVCLEFGRFTLYMRCNFAQHTSQLKHVRKLKKENIQLNVSWVVNK